MQSGEQKILTKLLNDIESSYYKGVAYIKNFITNLDRKDMLEGFAHLIVANKLGIIDAKYWMVLMLNKMIAIYREHGDNDYTDTLLIYLLEFAQDMAEKKGLLYLSEDEIVSFFNIIKDICEKLDPIDQAADREKLTTCLNDFSLYFSAKFPASIEPQYLRAQFSSSMPFQSPASAACILDGYFTAHIFGRHDALNGMIAFLQNKKRQFKHETKVLACLEEIKDLFLQKRFYDKNAVACWENLLDLLQKAYGSAVFLDHRNVKAFVKETWMIKLVMYLTKQPFNEGVYNSHGLDCAEKFIEYLKTKKEFSYAIDLISTNAAEARTDLEKNVKNKKNKKRNKKRNKKSKKKKKSTLSRAVNPAQSIQAEKEADILWPKPDKRAFEELYTISPLKFSYSNLSKNPILIFEYIKLVIAKDKEARLYCDIQHVLPYLDDKEKITNEQIFNELTQLLMAGRAAETIKLLIDFGIYQKLFACIDADWTRWLERKMLAIDSKNTPVLREDIFSLFLTAYIIDDLHEELVAYEVILNSDNNHEALRDYAALAMTAMRYPKELIDAILSGDEYIHFIISEIKTDLEHPKWYSSTFGLFQSLSNTRNGELTQGLVNGICKFGYPSKSGA